MPVLAIDRVVLDAIVAHARREHPEEACGLVAGPAGSDRPERLVEMTNAERSPTRYRFDPTEWYWVWREMEDRGEEPVVIYHSHTITEAYPSRTDISQADVPEAHYLLVSTREPETTEIRLFRILDGVVTEEQLQVVDTTVDDTTVDAAVDRDAVQSYLFGQTPATVDYECRSAS